MWNEIFDEQKYVFFHLYANVVMVFASYSVFRSVKRLCTIK